MACFTQPVGGDINRLAACTAFNIVYGLKTMIFLVSARHSGNQRFGIFMLGITQDLRHVSCFNDFAAIHHSNTRCDGRNHTNIMGDDDHTKLAFFTQLFNQIKNLRLDRNIQRSCGFICNDKLRFSGERQSDHYTLAHAA